MRNLAVLLVLIAFGVYSMYVMWQVGYFGIWQAGIANIAALQVLLDLVIVCTLASIWMLVDGRAKGLTAWPFVVVTIAAGSFGPLLYLLYRNRAA